MESVGIQCNVDLWHKIDPCIYERWFKHHRFEPTFIDIELKAAKFLKEKNFDEFFLLLDTFDLYSVFGTKYSVLEDLVMENRIEHAKRFALKAGMKQRLAELMCNEKFAKQAARMVKSEMFNWQHFPQLITHLKSQTLKQHEEQDAYKMIELIHDDLEALGLYVD